GHKPLEHFRVNLRKRKWTLVMIHHVEKPFFLVQVAHSLIFSAIRPLKRRKNFLFIKILTTPKLSLPRCDLPRIHSPVLDSGKNPPFPEKKHDRLPLLFQGERDRRGFLESTEPGLDRIFSNL